MFSPLGPAHFQKSFFAPSVLAVIYLLLNGAACSRLFHLAAYQGLKGWYVFSSTPLAIWISEIQFINLPWERIKEKMELQF